MKSFVALSLMIVIAPLSLFLFGQTPSGQAPSDASFAASSKFLSQTVTWYRRVVAESQIAATASDAVFVNDSAHVRDQIVRLAFDFGRSQEELSEQRAHPGQQPSDNSSRFASLSQMSGKLDAQAQQKRQDIGSLQDQMEAAKGRKRENLRATIAETQSELQLIEARKDVVHSMLSFVGSAAGSVASTGLSAQIDALSHSVPAALSAPPEAGSSSSKTDRAESNASNLAASTPPVTVKPEPTGLWGLIAGIVAASRKMQTLDQDAQSTNALAQANQHLQSPLIAQLRQMAQQSDQIAAQTNADTSAELTKNKGQIDQLTGEYKLISAAVVPLSKQAVLLDLYSRNLSSWRSSLKTQYIADLKNLLVRLISLGLVIFVVWVVAEIWRRAIFRYIHETRRRYQMLLLRRIASWFAIALVIAFSFATELGSLATFAGLLTAGVAVALQNVILSIAGYFFLIGKFGVRVGDRVQISGVNGEVVEIGLVRLHVIELGGSGRDLQPTGRIVAFANAFVFLPTAGMFKQIPGTNFMWHEIALTLAGESDYQAVEQRMIHAVDAAYAKYHDNLDRQRVMIERSLGSVSIAALKPRTDLRLTASGLEVKVNFPVDAQDALDIDDRITQEILKELNREPKLKIVGSDLPTIRKMEEAATAAKSS